MAKMLFISALILLAFYAKATKQREEFRDSNVRRDMTPRQVHELFPRVCGLHGWKKCGRRRSSVKRTQGMPKAKFDLNNENDLDDFFKTDKNW